MKIEKIIRILSQQLQYAARLERWLACTCTWLVGSSVPVGCLAHILGVFSSVPDGRLTHGRGLLLGRRHKFA